MAGAIAQPRNEIVDIADIIGKVAPLFTSQNKTTSEQSQSTIDPRVMAEGDALLSSLLERGNSTAQADNIVNDILHRAQLAFAPVLGEERAAGGYNSTTRRLLGQEAIARATAASASAVLDSQNHALQQATSLVNQRTAATRGTTTGGSVTQKAPINPMSLLAPLAAGFAKSKLFPDEDKKIKAAKNAQKIGSKVDKDLIDELTGESEIGNLSSNVSTAEGISLAGGGELTGFQAAEEGLTGSLAGYSPDSFSALMQNAAFTAPDLLAEGLGGEAFISGASAGFDAESFAGAADFFADGSLVEFGAAEVGTEGALAGAGAAGAVAGLPALLETISGGALTEGTAGIMEGVSDLVGFDDPAMSLLGSFGTGHICAELCRQQIVTPFYKARVYSKFSKVLSSTTILGYRYWSRYYVQLMQRSHLATILGRAFVFSWLGQVSKQPSAFGCFIHYIIRPITWLIGCLLETKNYGASLQRRS